MAQKIIIPAHKILISDLKKSIKNGKFNKIYFQCALKEIRMTGSHREAVFSIIAYAGKRNALQKWKVGKKVDCVVDNSFPAKEFILSNYAHPVGFGNNELYEFNFTQKEKKAKKTDKKKVKQDLLMEKIKKLMKDPQKSKTSFLLLKAKISANPHATYDVSLDGTSATANPSPPADPE